MVTEQQFDNFYLSVHGAAETMQDDFEEWYVPSPSGISKCRLQQWFQGNRYEVTNRIPVDSLKKMESGKVIEDYWRHVYMRAGYMVASPIPPIQVGQIRSNKGGDGMLFVETDEAASNIGIPVGGSALLELKDLGAWSYMDFVQKGLQEGLPAYYDQVQLYMEGYGRSYCVFHAGMADSSGTKWLWRRIRKGGNDIPPFWIEVVRKDPAKVMELIQRGGEVKWMLDNVTDRIPIELRDYDPHVLLAQKPNPGFPCGYCGYADTCVSAGAAGKVVPIR